VDYVTDLPPDLDHFSERFACAFDDSPYALSHLASTSLASTSSPASCRAFTLAKVARRSRANAPASPPRQGKDLAALGLQSVSAFALATLDDAALGACGRQVEQKAMTLVVTND
jgi:hypothetical protein